MTRAPECTVVVTGAAGFIGSHTVDCLLRHDHRVIGIDDLSGGSLANLSGGINEPGFDFVLQDIGSPGFLEGLCRRVRPAAVIHLASPVGEERGGGGPVGAEVPLAQVVADAVRLAGVPRVVLASSTAVYGGGAARVHRETDSAEPVSAGGHAQLLAEQVLGQYGRTYGFTAVSARYAEVIGPRQGSGATMGGLLAELVDAILQGRPVTVAGSGAEGGDFISVHDVARANLLAATAVEIPSGAVNIGTGRFRSLREVVAEVERQTGRPSGVRFEGAHRGEDRRAVGAPERAAGRLGFTAEVGFDDALAELIADLAQFRREAV